MATAKKGDGENDIIAEYIAKDLKQLSSAKGLRNLNRKSIEALREACAIFNAKSERYYVRIRHDQSPK